MSRLITETHSGNSAMSRLISENEPSHFRDTLARLRDAHHGALVSASILGADEVTIIFSALDLDEDVGGRLSFNRESLGLEESYMTTALDLHSCFQIFIGNLYPPCPQPELAMGLPPHSDHGLLTILLQNGVDGLQLKHKGNWVHVKPHPNYFLVNTGDHMEIISNGRYKSVVHRAVVNRKSTRISIANAVGPSLDTVVVPALQFVSDESRPVAYHGMRYREYTEHQQANPLKDKSVFDLIRM